MPSRRPRRQLGPQSDYRRRACLRRTPQVMKQYNLGPNGGILTAANLFATRFDQARPPPAVLPVETLNNPNTSLGYEHGLIRSAFATRKQVLGLVEKRAASLEHVVVDTPGQIEIFTWSASGQLVSEARVSPAAPRPHQISSTAALEAHKALCTTDGENREKARADECLSRRFRGPLLLCAPLDCTNGGSHLLLMRGAHAGARTSRDRPSRRRSRRASST